jgi:hypothetical protein
MIVKWGERGRKAVDLGEIGNAGGEFFGGAEVGSI